MAFTVKELLDYCLDQAQMDKNLSEHYSMAQKIYNLILSTQNDNYDYPFYNKVGSPTAFLSGVRAYDLPADYSRSDNCYRIDMVTGNRGSSIWIIPPWEFDKYTGAVSSSDPSVAWIDQDNDQIIFNSSMSVPGNKGFVLRYFRSFTPITVGSNIDDDTNPDFPDQKTAAELILVELLKYMNDDRYGMQKQIADEELKGTKMNAADYDDFSMVSLGKNFRAGRRPNRGGGYGFGE